VELRQLRYFIAVAEERHFGRAAERLRIAQPGLSQQIKALERSLGVQLFIRDHRHVELTDAGRALLGDARTILEVADRAKETVQLATRGKRGLLKVGTFVMGVLPVWDAILREFRDRVPDVELALHPAFSPEKIEALHRRELDAAALVLPARPGPDIGFVCIGSVEVLAALPEGHPLAALDRIPRSELMKEPFVAQPRGMDPGLVDHIRGLMFGPGEHPQVIEASGASQGSRMALVVQGKGIAVAFSAETEESRIPGVAYRRIEDPAPMVEVGVAWLEANDSPVVSEFLRVVRDVAGAAEPRKPVTAGA
jgi:DNA-binding transcriptional LysR family regulator